MRKNTKTRNLLMTGCAAVMAASMCMQVCAVSVPADGAVAVAATSTSTANVTVGIGDVNGETRLNGGDTVYAYQVVDIDYNETLNTVSYLFTNDFKTFLGNTLGEQWEDITPESYCELTEEELKPLLGAFAAYVKTTLVSATKNVTADGSGSATFENMEMGQYIILGGGSSTAAKIYQIVTVEVEPEVIDGSYQLYDTYEVEMKTSTPDVDKEIVAGTVDDTVNKKQEDTASIGDVVTYNVTVSVPTYPAGATNKTFYIGDSLSKGLELVGDASDFELKGYISEDDEEGVAINASCYVVTIDERDDDTDEQTIYIDIDLDKIASYQRIVVSYEAKLTQDAKIGTKDGNDNDVSLVYSNAPFDGTTWSPGASGQRPSGGGYGEDTDEEILYTYAFAIDKYDAENYQVKLSNAEFKLKMGDKEIKLLKVDGVYYVSDDGEAKSTVITDENGQVIVAGLKKGSYTLTETKAPSGFNQLDAPIAFEIGAESAVYTKKVTKISTKTTYEYSSDINEAQRDGEDNLITATDQAGRPLYFEGAGSSVMTTTATAYPVYIASQTQTTIPEVSATRIEPDDGDEDGYYLIGVANKKGMQLPSTGGVGTAMFYVVGGMLITVSFGALWYKRFKSQMKQK